MIDHLSIIVGDFPRAERFYDAIMTALGNPKVIREMDRIGYGFRASAEQPNRCYISVRPGLPKRSESRRHIAFRAATRGAVKEFYAAGLENGGSGDGAPGLRENYHPHYFAAFVIDPDGNRLEAVCHRPE